MIRFIASQVPLAVFAALLVSGCATGERDMTKTERQRQSVDPRVKEFLVHGERAYRNGDFLVALALSDSAEKYAPDFADVHFFRGRVYTDVNQIDIANVAYREALRADPEYRGAHMNLGVNLHRRGKLHEALREFEKEEELGEDPRLHLERGRVYAQLGVADSARMAYERAIELDSTNATAHMWLGQLYEETGDFQQALKHSRRGLELRPDNLDYQYIIGSQLLRDGRAEEALEYLLPVADQRAWHHAAQYNVGQALVRLDRSDEAAHYLDRATEAQQTTQEVNELNDALADNPDDLKTWLELAEVHREAGMYEKAAGALKVAVTLAPGNLGVHINLASSLLESGDVEGAIRHYKLVLDINPTLSDAWLNLGVAYATGERYDEARQAWERVVELRPAHKTARAYLARLDSVEEAG